MMYFFLLKFNSVILQRYLACSFQFTLFKQFNHNSSNKKKRKVSCIYVFIGTNYFNIFFIFLFWKKRVNSIYKYLFFDVVFILFYFLLVNKVIHFSINKKEYF